MYIIRKTSFIELSALFSTILKLKDGNFILCRHSKHFNSLHFAHFMTKSTTLIDLYTFQSFHINNHINNLMMLLDDAALLICIAFFFHYKAC